MNTKEVADALVKYCSEGKFFEAMTNLYSPHIVSVEAAAPPGHPLETKGIEGVMAKGKWWSENHEVHSSKVEGPLVAGSYFTVVFIMDVTFKPKKQRHTMEEVAVYKVADGKIVHEQFIYHV